ncbi:squalene--hopene cyclase [Streptomyces phytohabitans]|uniref:squalene--hopene cyclase n=1 Tax=Streptomyces phytohabitans TaxID=1150371 RepID=UPI00345C0B96
MTATADGSTGAVQPGVRTGGGPVAPAPTAPAIPAAAPAGDSATTPAGDPRVTDPRALAERANARAVAHLLALQHEEGWWKGDLETNVTMDAEDLLLREFLGVRDAHTTGAAARHVRSRQRADGTWGTFHGGPGDLSTTVEAYVALRLAGDAPEAPHMRAAAGWVRAHGGIAGTRVFTRVWLALFGWWRWTDLPELPPEIIWLPKWFPLNLHDFGCWARQTIVPLTVVSAYRPVRPAPFGLDELHRDPARPNPVRAKAPAYTWDGAFQRLDGALHAYRGVALRGLRRAALRDASRWIVERQENDGCWGGIQPPAVYSLIALRLLGYDLDHPVLRAGLESLDRFAVWREETADEPGGGPAGAPVRMVEACQSPVWDTCLATVALTDAGLPADHPALTRAADWMLGEQVVRPGDWAVRRPQLPPGGWAFEFHNANYPDIDDTAEVVLALHRVRHADPERVDRVVRRAVRWTLGMQSANGGWGAFDADNTSELPDRLPFCDFGEVVDPPSADVTAHVVEMLSRAGHRDHPANRRAVAWLLAQQEPGGAWFGRWGVNYLYGTGAVVPALVDAGLPATHPALRRAVHWLVDVQNEDGGWGEDLRSYRDPDWAGRGASTPSQTAWALLALLAAGERDGDAVRRGVAHLAGTQRADGTWDEPWFTGTGFPWDFSINYHLYRLVFPVTALGRYLHGGTGTSTGTGDGTTTGTDERDGRAR